MGELDDSGPLRTLFARAATGIAYKAADGRYRWANEAFAAMHRIDADVIPGATDADLVDPFAASGRQARDALARERGEAVQFQEIVTDALEGRLTAPSTRAGVSWFPHHSCATSCATTAKGKSISRGSSSGRRMANPSW